MLQCFSTCQIFFLQRDFWIFVFKKWISIPFRILNFFNRLKLAKARICTPKFRRQPSKILIFNFVNFAKMFHFFFITPHSAALLTGSTRVPNFMPTNSHFHNGKLNEYVDYFVGTCYIWQAYLLISARRTFNGPHSRITHGMLLTKLKST